MSSSLQTSQQQDIDNRSCSKLYALHTACKQVKQRGKYIIVQWLCSTVVELKESLLLKIGDRLSFYPLQLSSSYYKSI